MNDPTKNEDSFRLNTFMHLVTFEQNQYWQRFAAFAGLHAGLFVLMTVSSIHDQFLPAILVSTLSMILAALWAWVQAVSLNYVKRWKPNFHGELKNSGIEAAFDSDPKYSASKIALGVPALVFLIWLVLLVNVLFEAIFSSSY